MSALVSVVESRGRPVLPVSPVILQTPVLFDVVEVSPGLFDFVGSARGRIVMNVNDRGHGSVTIYSRTFQGSNSSIRLTGCSAMRLSTSRTYAMGSMPLSAALPSRL